VATELSADETRANARLISAAPELLEAAREACDFISSHFENLTTGEIEGDAGEPLSALYSAISKALGPSAHDISGEGR